MTLEQTEQGNVNSRTVQLVKLLSELGPDVPEISRKLGQFKESVRYRYKEKILSKGFAVQAAVDHEKLGLKRMVMILDFAEIYRDYAQAIFAAMNELAYLVGFAKELIGGRYLVTLSVPSGLEEGTREFFMGLRERGMFTSVEVVDFEWFRNVPMKAEFYDFDTGIWDFELSDPSARDPEGAAHEPSEPAKFDAVDLLVLKELQMDANKSLKEIADKLQINYKKLAWHYATHVLPRKLIRGYTVNWMGTRYDYALEKALHRKHKYFAVMLVVRNPEAREVMTLRQELNRLPFLWSEAVGRNYCAEIFFPVDFVVDGLQYLGKATSTVRDKISIYPIDQTDAMAFTISYKLYDEAQHKWLYDWVGLTKRFEEVILQIKMGAH